MKKVPPPNFPFDVAELIYALLRKDPKHVSKMAELLEIQTWIPRLWETGGRHEVLAGTMLVTAVMSAHSDARNWERLASFLEFLSEIDTDFELEWVDQVAGHVKATWTHPFLLKFVPKPTRQRLVDALNRGFFQANFDQEFYDLRWQGLDQMQAREREERAAKRKAAKERQVP